MPQWKIVGKDGKRFAVTAASAEEAIGVAERRGVMPVQPPTRIDAPPQASVEDESWMEPDPSPAPPEIAAMLGPDPILTRSERMVYKVVEVAESALSNVLVGEGKVTSSRLERAINEQAAQGWRLVFQVERRQRRFGVFMRDVVLLTFERRFG